MRLGISIVATPLADIDTKIMVSSAELPGKSDGEFQNGRKLKYRAGGEEQTAAADGSWRRAQGLRCLVETPKDRVY